MKKPYSNKIKSILYSILFSLFLYSCQTSNAFKVPGETQIIAKNIASEYFAIAEGYMDLKKYDKAAQYYSLAMKNKSLRLSAYYKMARAYALARDYEKALSCYEDLIKLDPDNKDLALSLAYIKGMSGKIDESILMYKDLSQKYPNDSSVLENYITLLLYIGRTEDAEVQFYILAEKFPNNENLKNISDKINEALDNPTETKEVKTEKEEKSK
ncbi:tetratricopeptide repeat protein [Treponema pectinovorum]|uniref:tetratricopeptide repeat protein n=1 Tax=Treponema pectinovorum TaxID=164 RepID=UPI00164D21EE|nr:tetratricopeptide repeat protein [Treponema pectinovorum]